MPHTYASIILALSTLAAAACRDVPTRPSDAPPHAERSVARTVDGKIVHVRYDGRTATISVDGRPTLRLRYDGDRRHVTAFLADGRRFERSYTAGELAQAARGAPRPSLDYDESEYDEDEYYEGVSDGSDQESLKCSKEWVTYAGAALVAVVTCSATGPLPPCAAAVAAAAIALDALVTCELKNAPFTV